MMIQSENSKFFLLEEGEVILAGDEFYNPCDDRWDSVEDGLPDEEGNYPNAFIGYEWCSQESKPVRRENPNYLKQK